MPVTINGLPAHVLLIHAVVVLLPLAALMLIACAVWPAARAKLGFLSPAVALVALVLVPITTHAGEWLQDHLGFTSKAIRRHADLGDQLLPWAAGIFVMSVVVWVLHRRFEMAWRPGRAAVDQAEPGERVGRGEPGGAAEDGHGATGAGGTATLTRPSATGRTVLPLWITAVVAVLSIAVSVGGGVQLYRIGDSGAKAVWSGVGQH